MADFGGWVTKAPPPMRKKGLLNNKLLIVLVVAIVLSVVVIIAYFDIELNSALATIRPVSHGPLPKASISGSITEQDLLTYSNIKQYVPYLVVSYKSRNVSAINLNATALKYPPPQNIYILNISNECFNCGNTQAIENSFENKLIQYNIIKSPSQVPIVSTDALTSLPNDSLLVVINGLLPSDFFNNVSGNTTLMEYLLIRHDSVLYVGQSPINMLLPDSIVTPSTNPPGFLAGTPYANYNQSYKKGNPFHFDNSSFRFVNGTTYEGYLTYINALNGSIAAFPNTPSTWHNSTAVGYDLAKAVEQLFWLPKYAFGTRTVNVTDRNSSSGQIGVLLNAIPIPFNASLASLVDDNGSMRVALTADAYYPNEGISNSTYQYAVAKPVLYYNGTFGIMNTIITNQTVPLTFNILTHSAVPVDIQPHLTVYTLNSTQVFTTPLPFIHNVSNNFTFILPYQRLVLQPAQTYIIKLQSFQSTEYSAALFNVSPLILTLIYSNATGDQFAFAVTSNKQQINNLPYSMELNGEYPANGVIKNGTLQYGVAKGTPTIVGVLNFTLTTSNSKFYYVTYYNPLPFGINSEYIEVGVVIVLMLVMIVFVRAPNRDEFFVDVPSLPEEKKVAITLHPKEVVGIFDKLNQSYHWKYMPLSKAEIKAAIASYIKYNNIPVGLTYSNIERILDELTVNKYLVNADNMYAPAQWETQSKHDVEYLATFKKLRLWFVTHAYIFTDIDTSENADIVATLHTERKYVIIASKTSKFQKIPIYTGSKTYIAFLNAYKLDEFKTDLLNTYTPEAEELKMYLGADYVKLVDADNPEGLLN